MERWISRDLNFRNWKFLKFQLRLKLVAVNLPRLNRLTGLAWGRLCNHREGNLTFQQSQAWIATAMERPTPCSIGKLGTCELLGLEYLDRWVQLPWPRNASWYRPAQRLFHSAGVFPIRRDIYYRWASLYRAAVRQLDFVAQWQPEGSFLDAYEQAFLDRELPHAVRGNFHSLDPVGAPWLQPLAKLRWLVISPFCETIRAQLPRLPQLKVFHGIPPETLAQAASDCRLLPCPQLPYMVPPVHRDWFHGLGEMKRAMDEMEFDVAVIGAGAWSVPLAVHAKTQGRIGIHLGGTLNLLFGIRGGRFEDRGLYNEHWIRPVESERPANHRLLENGAYW